MWLLLHLAAAALACSPRDAEHTGTFPADSVPADARLVVTIGNGLVGGQAFDVTVWGADPTTPIPATSGRWCVDEGSPSIQTCWLTLLPDGGWVDGQTYRIEVHADASAAPVWSGEVTGSAAPIVPASGTPQLEVPSGAALPYPSTCDYDPAFTYDLRLVPAFADPDGLSLLQLYRAGDLVGTWWAPTDGSPLEVALTLPAATDPADDCFVLVQADASGAETAPSAEACLAADAGDTGDTGDTGEDDPGRGCSTGGGAASAVLALLASLALRRRRP